MLNCSFGSRQRDESTDDDDDNDDDDSDDTEEHASSDEMTAASKHGKSVSEDLSSGDTEELAHDTNSSHTFHAGSNCSQSLKHAFNQLRQCLTPADLDITLMPFILN